MNRMFKRFLALLFVALGVLLTPGCHQEQKVETETIQLMHGWGGVGDVHETMRSIYADFSKYDPDIRLNCIAAPVSDITIEKANDMLAVNKMADVVSTNGIAQFVFNAVTKDKALNLMPYIEADSDLKNSIDPSVFQTWLNEDGTLYTVPDALEVMGYWYNKKIFQNAGIEEPPATWEEFWIDCEKISEWAQRSGEDVTPFALEKEQIVECFLPAYIAGKSKDGLEFVSTQPNSFDTAVFRTGLQGIKYAYQYSRGTTGIEDARQAFRNGRIAIYFNGLWECEEFKASAAETDLTYANFPTDFGKTLSFVSPASGYVLCRSGDEKRQEASVTFLKYILSEEQQTRIFQETGQVPCNPNVSIESAEQERPLLVSALKEARKANIQIKSISSVWDGRVINELKESVEEFGKDRLTEDELIEKLDAQ